MGPWVLGSRCPLPLCLCFWRRHPVTTALRPWPLRDWERGGRRSPLLLSVRCPRSTDCSFYLEWPSAASLPPPPEPGPLGLALRHQFQIPTPISDGADDDRAAPRSKKTESQKPVLACGAQIYSYLKPTQISACCWGWCPASPPTGYGGSSGSSCPASSRISPTAPAPSPLPPPVAGRALPTSWPCRPRSSSSSR